MSQQIASILLAADCFPAIGLKELLLSPFVMGKVSRRGMVIKHENEFRETAIPSRRLTDLLRNHRDRATKISINN
jgi:hypothetical protein